MPRSEQTERNKSLAGTVERLHFLRILFIHRSPMDIERCLHELRRVGFTVSSDVVMTPQEFIDRMGSQCFDLILAEYPSPNWQGEGVLDRLRQLKKAIPVIFLVHCVKRETVAELILKGGCDCIEMGSISHLPVAIHRAQEEKKLRDERDRAEKDLGRSEARYRALAGNLNYGICLCDLDGKFLDVNDAMVSMLGYISKEDLLTVNLKRDIIQDLAKCEQLFEQSGEGRLMNPVEMNWTRKDHATLKVHLSGQAVVSSQGDLNAYELIAEDVTKQRELECRLRKLAASDPLTGLANYRHLVDVLDKEIKRSERTSREFAVLLFDLDGLKVLNDRYGHITGSQALCRVADVLSFCCRDIDTASRFGGDEFALVLPETSTQAANLVARRICDSVAHDGKGPMLSISVGAAVYPHDGENIESLLSAADTAMYSMKGERVSAALSKQAAPGR
jgi:diguanylate cyclase (GGDEF)-like protein/PAS domain S-box-containing protein